MRVDEIYLFKTIDKDPYLLVPDADAFTRNDPTNDKKPIIQELKLNPANDVFFHFKDCIKADFDYTVSQGSITELPYQGQGRSIYSYKLQINLNNETKAYDIDFLRTLSQLSHSRFQIAYKSEKWFVCYAEFSLQTSTIDNFINLSITLEANNVKEEIFNIKDFDHPENIIGNSFFNRVASWAGASGGSYDITTNPNKGTVTYDVATSSRIQQTSLSTIVGQDYLMSFSYFPKLSTASGSARVIINGPTTDETAVAMPLDGSYEKKVRWYFVASGTSLVSVQLRSLLSQPGLTIVYDNFQIYPIENPNGLIINGFCESDAFWSDKGTPTTNERSATQSFNGTYSRHVEADQDDGISCEQFDLEQGAEYILTAHVYIITGTVRIETDTDGLDFQSIQNSTLNEWVKIRLRTTALKVNDRINVVSRFNGGEFFLGQMSLEKVKNAD